MKNKEYIYYCEETGELLLCGLKQKYVKTANIACPDLSKGKFEDIFMSLFNPQGFKVWNFIGEI